MNKKEQIACVNLKFNNKLQLMVLNPKDKQLPDSVKGRCLTVSSEGDFVIGCKDGTVRVIDNKMSPNNCRSISKK